MPSTELRIFAAAMAVETAHLIDDGLLNPHDGVTDVPSTLISIAIARSPPSRCTAASHARPARSSPACSASPASSAGLDMHVLPALQHGAAGSDYTGFGQAAAGPALLVLAALLALRPAPAAPQPV